MYEFNNLHNLIEKNLMDCIFICDSMYQRNFETMTGDEKWIVYNNFEWKRSWGKQNEPPLATPKAGLYPKKVTLYVWWDWKGILLNYELLPNDLFGNTEQQGHNPVKAKGRCTDTSVKYFINILLYYFKYFLLYYVIMLLYYIILSIEK